VTLSLTPRVVQLPPHEGVTYYPVMRGGRVLDLAALQALVTTVGAHPAVRRRLRVVLLDETELEGGWSFNCQLDASQCRDAKMPLVLSEGTLPIGVVEAITPQQPGAVPETVGHSLVADVRLFDSVLADVAWTALEEPWFGGICCDIDSEEDPMGLSCQGQFWYVRLLPREGAHIPGCRVLERWTEPA
jgi:hypothetical protein